MNAKIFLLGLLFFCTAGFALAQEVNTNQALSALADLQAMADGGRASDILDSLGVNASTSTNSIGSSAASGFSVATIIAGLLFGTIGFAAFIYGKKQGSWKPLVIGLVLMGYPYFVTDPFWLFGIGAGLTILLFVWRD